MFSATNGLRWITTGAIGLALGAGGLQAFGARRWSLSMAGVQAAIGGK